LSLAIVADRGSRRVDPAGHRRVGDGTAAPDPGNQIVLADHTVAVLDQIDQQVEHLRLDSDALARAMQFAPVGVERAIHEAKQQSPLLRLNQTPNR